MTIEELYEFGCKILRDLHKLENETGSKEVGFATEHLEEYLDELYK